MKFQLCPEGNNQLVARLDRTEMDRTMRELVDRLYTLSSRPRSGGAGNAPRSPTGRGPAMGQAKGRSRSEKATRSGRKRNPGERRAGGGRRGDKGLTGSVSATPPDWRRLCAETHSHRPTSSVVSQARHATAARWNDGWWNATSGPTCLSFATVH